MDNLERNAEIHAEGGAGTDAQMLLPPFTGSGDCKKSEAEYEMLAVRNLSHRAFYQCLVVFVVIGITLAVMVAQNPYKYYVPVASHLIGFGGVVMYCLIMLAMLTCSRDASTRFVLVVCVTLLLGLCIGFLTGVNVAIASPNLRGIADVL
jgi:hypothetical protein